MGASNPDDACHYDLPRTPPLAPLAAGACERIFKTPIPIVYTGHTSRFVGVWLGMLPLAIWGIDGSWNHLVTIPSSAAIVFFLLGIEELGLQVGY